MAPTEIAAAPFLPPGNGARQGFDPDALEASTGREWLYEFVFSYPQRLLGLVRFMQAAIYLPFFGIHFVLRHDEVREVLSHDGEFPVPWTGKMEDLTNGRNFVLGMPRDERYRQSYRQLAEAFPLRDIPERIARPAAAHAAEIVERAGRMDEPRLDAVQELITAVPTRLCESYYGIEIGDPVNFAKWSLASSSDIFASFDEAASGNARAAAASLSDAIRGSIKAAAAGKGRGPVIKRMLDAGLDEDAIHAHLYGMVLGFIPTNVLAGGNMLETLLRRRDFLERARAAALADDDELLWRCLRETLRFRHINPGAVRRCANGYTLGAGGARAYPIGKGDLVLACIQSAMFDPRRIEHPDVFDPYRRDEDYLTFGVGQHWCLGAYIAKAQLTQTFKPLLKRKGLHALGMGKARVKRFNNLYPLHLAVGFER